MLLAAKNYEARIMNAVPLGVILYMWVFSPGFLEPLYHNAAGAIIMTIMLLVYIGSFCLTKKIVNICI